LNKEGNIRPVQGANLSIYIGSPLALGIFFNDLIIKCLENKKEYSIFVASENGWQTNAWHWQQAFL